MKARNIRWLAREVGTYGLIILVTILTGARVDQAVMDSVVAEPRMSAGCNPYAAPAGGPRTSC
jgi:hypothetical protein